VNKTLDLDKYRKLLLAERERLQAEHDAVTADLSDSAGEQTDYDHHDPADSASETFEHSKDFAIDENFHDMLERITEALRKLDDGTYGLCDRCDSPILPERLKAIPYATLCINCQEKLEIR
jgi:RNA polymerase-binding protein DksA